MTWQESIIYSFMFNLLFILKTKCTSHFVKRAIFDLFLPVFENPVHEKTCFGVIDKELTESV